MFSSFQHKDPSSWSQWRSFRRQQQVLSPWPATCWKGEIKVSNWNYLSSFDFKHTIFVSLQTAMFQGQVVDACVVCPAHNTAFDLKTGAVKVWTIFSHQSQYPWSILPWKPHCTIHAVFTTGRMVPQVPQPASCWQNRGSKASSDIPVPRVWRWHWSICLKLCLYSLDMSLH